MLNDVSLLENSTTPSVSSRQLGFIPRSLSQPVSGGKLCVAMPVMDGVNYPIKGVERLGHPQHFLDAVLYVDNRPKSRDAEDSCCECAFCQCIFRTPLCSVFLFRSFFKLCAVEWLQYRSSWQAARSVHHKFHLHLRLAHFKQPPPGQVQIHRTLPRSPAYDPLAYVETSPILLMPDLCLVDSRASPRGAGQPAENFHPPNPPIVPVGQFLSDSPNEARMWLRS